MRDKNWTTLLVVLIIITYPTFSSAQTVAPSTVNIVPGLEKFRWMYPLVDVNNEYRGFITSSTGNTAFVFDQGGIVIDSIIFPDSIKSLRGFWSSEHDGPIVYMVTYDYDQVVWNDDYPNITVYLATPGSNEYKIDSLSHLACTGSIMYSQSRKLEGVSASLEVIYDDSGVPEMLAIRTTTRWSEWEMTQGSWNYTENSYGLVSLDLKEEFLLNCANTVAIADLDGDTIADRAGATNFSVSHVDDPWNSYDSRGTSSSIGLGNGIGVGKYTSYGKSNFWISGNFIPESPYDEVIYYGYAYDLLDLHGESALHIACYSVSDTTVIEEWYVEGEIRLHYFWYSANKLISYTKQQFVKQMDLATGTWLDSTRIDRNVSYAKFFSAGTPEILNVIGRVNDTLFRYQMDVLTDINDYQNPTLPNSIRLALNYPNPFNGITTISFENPTNQHLSLRIYNILGRTVTVLKDQYFEAGSHSVQWDGLDSRGQQVATGIYFVRLSSPTQTSSIRISYIK